MSRTLSQTSLASKLSTKRKQSMVKIEFFEIHFDNEDWVFYAGTQVTGTIILCLKEEKKVNEILLELKGKAKTYWTKHSGKSRQHYTDSEPYFCEQFNTEYTHAYGKPKDRVLPAGRHEIPFAYTLPAVLPSSFEGEFGHCRYTCTATLERPWDFDIVTTKVFTVVGIEDLNENNDARESVDITDSEFDVSRCWRRVGSIHVDLHLAKAGYVPGEKLLVDATIRNESSRTIKYATARVKQHISYRAKSFMGKEGEKEVINELVKVEKGAIPAHGVQNWKDVPLEIPPVPPKLVKCKVVDINYSLQLEVDPGLAVIAPLYIGNVPLVEQHIYESMVHRPSQNGATVDKPRVSWPQPGSRRGSNVIVNPVAEKYPFLPAPTFDESFTGKYDVRECNQTASQYPEPLFAPRYPCYRFEGPIVGLAPPVLPSTIEIIVEDHEETKFITEK